MPSNSGTPAATAAPNASSRISSVPPIDSRSDRASSLRAVSPSAFSCEASPNSSTRTCGCAFWAAPIAASGASAACSSPSASARSPASVNFTSTERPSSDTRLAPCVSWSGLSIALTPSRRCRRLTTSFTAAVTRGSPASTAPLPCTSTCSVTCFGKSAAAMICSPRLDSPLPDSDCSRFVWPMLPPISVATMTKAIQPRIAVLRCAALQRPVRAARLFGLISSPPSIPVRGI